MAPPDDAQLIPSPRDHVIEAVLMMLAILPVIVSAYASLVTGEGHWFQRSGALMVLFSFAVEYHRNHMMRRIAPEGVSLFGHSQWLVSLITRFWRSVPYICYLAIFIGTLIWSYGDLLF